MRRTVKWGESGLAGRVGTKFRSWKTETRLHEQALWFSESFRRSIENSLSTTENSLVQSILCFQGSKLRPNSPRLSRLAPFYEWGESGLAGWVGTMFRTSKTETHLHEQTYGFSGALRRSIENSLCTTGNSPVQSILCFQASKLCPNSPRQSRLAPLYGTNRWNLFTPKKYFDVEDREADYVCNLR